MHRVDAAGYAPGNLFTDGNPATGTPATVVDAAIMTALQENIAQAIEGAGIALVKGNHTQLLQAIQALVASGGFKTPTRAATTANITTLAGGAPNTLDGVSLAVNDRVLVKDQTTAAQNGLYIVTTLGTGANGTWTRSTDADGAGELFAGMLVVVNEGTTNADSIWELSTDGAITIGTTAIVFSRKDSSNAGSVQGASKNLQASATGLNATVMVSADEIVVEDSIAFYKTLRAVSLSINSAGSGANGLDTGLLAASTWYSIWVIYNPATQTTAGLLSLSTTAPTMPSGYTYKARVGWIRTDGTGNKYPLGFKQYGRRVQYVVATGSNIAALPIINSGTQGSVSTPTWVASSVSGIVPPTAGCIGISLAGGITGSVSMAAQNNSYGQYNSTTNPPPVVVNNSQTVSAAEFILESSSIYYASNAGTSGLLMCSGWEDNI